MQIKKHSGNFLYLSSQQPALKTESKESQSHNRLSLQKLHAVQTEAHSTVSLLGLITMWTKVYCQKYMDSISGWIYFYTYIIYIYLFYTYLYFYHSLSIKCSDPFPISKNFIRIWKNLKICSVQSSFSFDVIINFQI